MTYMAACEDTTCDKFNSSGAKWFKIDEAGQSGSGWVQQEISANPIASHLSLVSYLYDPQWKASHTRSLFPTISYPEIISSAMR